MTDKKLPTMEEIVAAYRDKGLKPRAGVFAVYRERGVYVCPSGECCPIGALLVGTPDSSNVKALYPGLNGRSFVHGFDDVTEPRNVRPRVLRARSRGAGTTLDTRALILP